MKIQLIFPARPIETARSSFTVMPLSLKVMVLLASGPRAALIDMFAGDRPDYEVDTDLVGITVRTPVAIKAHEIADEFLRRGKKVVRLAGKSLTRRLNPPMISSQTATWYLIFTPSAGASIAF